MRRLIAILFFGSLVPSAVGQLSTNGRLTGAFQSDIQIYQDDEVIGAEAPPEKFGSNSYLNLQYTSELITAGARFESYSPPLLGFDPRYEGVGVPFRFVSVKKEAFEITAGNIYEQFGSGLLLRTYQDWGLGLDNSIDGIRVKYQNKNGVRLTGLMGKQRFYFDKGPGTVRGVNLDLNLNQLLDSVFTGSTQVELGISGISKYQEDQDPIYNLPENVAAVSTRLSLTGNSFQGFAEYGYKVNDPTFTNSNSYSPGQALFVNAAYFKKGFSLGVNLKRLDNFELRTDRTATGNDLLTNYLPPITINYTYRLFSLYPYVTQPLGEMGGQFDLQYKLKKESVLGGKYGGRFALNYTRIHSTHQNEVDDARLYESPFFKVGGEKYYEALTVELNRKWSKKLKTLLTYQYFEANNKILLVTDFEGTIKGHIAVLETQLKLSKKRSLRTELQTLITKQDDGSWITFLGEYYLNRQLFLAILDDYNVGNPDVDGGIHYLSGTLGFKKGGFRGSIGYGRQRAGVLCVGGVCRVVPATTGLTMSLAMSF
jgi:hypothetical protein